MKMKQNIPVLFGWNQEITKRRVYISVGLHF